MRKLENHPPPEAAPVSDLQNNKIHLQNYFFFMADLQIKRKGKKYIHKKNKDLVQLKQNIEAIHMYMKPDKISDV